MTFPRRNAIFGGAILAASGVAILASSAQSQGQPERPNRIIGTWAPAAFEAMIDGKLVRPHGPAPTGSLIFTDNGRFSVIMNDPRLARFSTEDRERVPDAELLRAAKGHVSLYGTYTVGEDGQFFRKILEGSSVPNWVGLRRGREVLTMNANAAGDTITERFTNPPNGPPYSIIWKRVS
ncbi:MAG: hypothetical protein AVDCRST_MAG91-1228 [uncultured Sphingomonadaceae bacterium]|uniref:Lipocalin-like domain-containing protein n=1 Tax=uncultured Sphingomonadaceae bacterium TaxID=169976 RepID=A0A6J4SSW2_9SPHN|nr:MAG: hypothetical protein AVDCRST_MAG91-1228 [uncultured Sphingomonadaceae bacterium]